MIDFYDQLSPTLVQTWHESTPQMSQINEFFHRSPISVTAIDLLMPSLEPGLVAVYRDLASLRSLRIVNAITAYTPQERHPPTGLDSLGLPEASTIEYPKAE